MKNPPIKLVKNNARRAFLETKDHYDVLLFDQKVSELYFNIKGYCAEYGLPTYMGYQVEIGEKGLTTFKKEIAFNNKQFNIVVEGDCCGGDAATTLIVERRKEIYERFTVNLTQYTGYWIQARNGIVHEPNDIFSEVYFVSDSKEKSSVAVQLVVEFYPNTAIMKSARFSGNEIKQSHLFPYKIMPR